MDTYIATQLKISISSNNTVSVRCTCSEDEGGLVDGVVCWLGNTSDPVTESSQVVVTIIYS